MLTPAYNPALGEEEEAAASAVAVSRKLTVNCAEELLTCLLKTSCVIRGFLFHARYDLYP